MPCPLPNSRIGIIAPAGPPLDEGRLQAGFSELGARGFDLVRPRQVYPTHGYLAGGDAERAREFAQICRDPSIDVVLSVRGGYGTLRLLDLIDFDLAAARPRVLVGYSDLTALQLALHSLSGWTGLSGPMVAVEWPEPDPRWEEPLWKLLAGTHPMELTPADGSSPRCLRPGVADGTLLGGNLAMVTRLLGTPYEPDFGGALLFLEDVGEAPYRVDGMLAHLRLAGVLDEVAGVILGGFTGVPPQPERPSQSIEEVFEHYFAKAPYPVVSQWNYGHFPIKVSMPIGVRARLSAGQAGVRLTMLDPLLPGV